MKNTKQNAPLIHDFRFNFSKQNTVYVFFFQRGKGTYVKTLEVYNVKTLEVYNVKALEVFVYQIFTGGDMLIIRWIQPYMLIIPNIELM